MANGTKTAEAVREAVAPVLAALGVTLYDVEVLGAGPGGPGRTVRVTVDSPGGIDLESVAGAAGPSRRSSTTPTSLPGPTSWR
ncbi:MAG: ribosome maturation factor RimP [Acidimicrobiia bacterium]|nr:ribosome maturation factor RimP [Acidimicrobiia bacterium]